MRALITGGLGFVGSNLVDRLIDQGHDVVVVDSLIMGNENFKNEKAEYHIHDVIDIEKLGIGEVDVVFHLAALARIQPSFEKPFLTLENNIMCTVAICDYARKVGAKIVYAGSSSFYAGPHLNPYAFSKWNGEELCKLYNEVFDVPVSIARFFNVYGPRHTTEGAYATVVGIFERQYLANEALTITWDGEQRRDFTHVNDICQGLIKMSHDKWNSEIFNLGTGKNHSINELASFFETDTVYIPKRPGEARTTLADLEFSKEKLGYKPQHDIEEYVKSWVGDKVYV